MLSPEVDHREVRKVDENTDINVPRRQPGDGQNGVIGRNSRRSQHIDNIEYPPGKDPNIPSMEEEHPFPSYISRGCVTSLEVNTLLCKICNENQTTDFSIPSKLCMI